MSLLNVFLSKQLLSFFLNHPKVVLWGYERETRKKGGDTHVAENWQRKLLAFLTHKLWFIPRQ